MAKTARLSPKEIKENLNQQDTQSLLSFWPFLKQQNGWRPSKLHLVIGPSGAGKSTYVRSVITDFLLCNQDHKMMLVLSEETIQDFQTDINRIPFAGNELDRVFIVSEQDQNFGSFKEYGTEIERKIEELDIDFLIVDNLTTSEFYAEKKSDQQITICRYWKSLAQRLFVPVLLIAHTAKEVTENYRNIISPENIRGSSNIVNIAEFIYVLQPMYVGDERHLFMRVCKSRGQAVKNTIYSLHWHEKKRVYGRIEISSFSTFQEIFKTRNQL